MVDADSHILWAGLLIDNLNPEPLIGAALVIREGIIQQVLQDFVPGSCPELNGVRLVDLREYTLLPGFIDCHVHLALDGIDFQAFLDRWLDEKDWLPQVRQALSSSSNCGIAAIRDGSDKGRIGLGVKQRLEAGELTGPLVLSCGQAVARQGMYGSFLGPGVNNLVEAYALIDQNLAEGADWIKVVVSGRASFQEYEKVGPVQFSQAELNSIVGHAHARGVQVMAHASSDHAVSLAVKAGVDSVEHGFFVSRASLEAMAEHNIPWVPTVACIACTSASSANSEVIRRTYELQLDRIFQARDLGVTIGVGTDAGALGVAHGLGYWRELQLLAQAGLSNREIIRAATLNSARICGLGRRFGSIEPGKSAAVIAVQGNPLADLSVLQELWIP